MNNLDVAPAAWESGGKGKGDRPRKFDLEERTAKFGEGALRMLKSVPDGPHTRRLIDQLTGCTTSVGANYCEANNALSRRDFRKSIGICRKESRECMHFFRMLAVAHSASLVECRVLWCEARALNRIFARVFRSTSENDVEGGNS